jgi:NAD(P)H-dependent flavin oxidoreductase YrpB (nitropropane dioxygenase family)
MIETAFTRLLRVTAPLQLAAMPGVATPALLRAVADAGAVAMLPTPMLPPAALGAALDALGEPGPGAFGVNFLMPFLDVDCVDLAARRARLVEFFYGAPDAKLVARAGAHGARVSWQVGSLDEARAAERAGCDLVVAQGTEAGGHVRGRSSLLPLLSQVIPALRIPVLAAGGLATGRDVAAVLACGAAGARIGTRFVASRESGAHPAWVAALLAAGPGDTCLTEAYSVMWPDAPHRVLRSAVAAAEALPDGAVGETQLGGERVPVARFSVVCPSAETTGHVEAMALYAGESVANVTRVAPAAGIVAELLAEAEDALRASGRPA